MYASDTTHFGIIIYMVRVLILCRKWFDPFHALNGWLWTWCFVARFEHMWIAVPLNLIMVMFVLFLMALTKLWMFGAPRVERHMPAYSLHVMKELPPDIPVTKTYNPYTAMAKPSYDASGRKVYNNRQVRAPQVQQSAFVHNAPHRLGHVPPHVYQ